VRGRGKVVAGGHQRFSHLLQAARSAEDSLPVNPEPVVERELGDETLAVDRGEPRRLAVQHHAVVVRREDVVLEKGVDRGGQRRQVVVDLIGDRGEGSRFETWLHVRSVPLDVLPAKNLRAKLTCFCDGGRVGDVLPVARLLRP